MQNPPRIENFFSHLDLKKEAFGRLRRDGSEAANVQGSSKKKQDPDFHPDPV